MTEAYRLYKPGKALAYSLSFSIVAFAWAAFVAMTPRLANVPAIPYIANNYIISFPVILVWPVMALFLSRRYLRSADDKAAKGLKLGVMSAALSFLLDFLVVALLVGEGIGHFALIIPWLIGRSSERLA